MKKIRIGIIGAGRIGQLHANNIFHSDLLELKMIADINIEHLKNTRFENMAPMITNKIDKIFEDPEIDAIFICSSTDSHIGYIEKAAKAGKHIFCEKPISFNPEETRKILKIVKENDVKFQVGFNRRFDRHFRKVHNVVRDGEVGNPHVIKISSRDPNVPAENYVKKSGGMFMDMTIHDFDMIRFLSGSEVVDITVKAANLIDPMFAEYDDVDTAIITLTFESGAIGVIDNSRKAVYGYDQRIEVFGDKGAVEAQNETDTNVKISIKDNVILDPPKAFFLERYNHSYITEVNEFAQAILEGKEPICTGNDGYMAEMLAFAARKSWKEGRTVKASELNFVSAKV